MPAAFTLTKELLMARTRQAGSCRLYTGNINKKTGYGSLWYRGRTSQAHIVSFELHKGPVPPGKCVLHTCDVRPCIEPDHLYPGTKKQNTADAYARGRAVNRRGKEHGMSKLTPELVAQLRRRYKPYDPKHNTEAIARELGLSQATIYAAIKGSTWKHVP
jgi:hypothetical protein